jgi:hypothetical protein
MRHSRADRFREAGDLTSPRVANPVLSAVQFAHLTNTDGGASMNVHTNQIAKPGDEAYFVGGEPDSSGQRIPTHTHGSIDIDASGGYRDLNVATQKMGERNEAALWDMSKMENVFNPNYDDAAAQSSKVPVSSESALSPLDVIRHKARLVRDGGRNPAMTLGSWKND